MTRTPVERVKAYTGFIAASTPASTALDLVRFASDIGGLDAVMTVLEDLVEKITPEDLLNAGVMLDLRLAVFGINTCARTLLGKADVIVWRTDTNRFHLEVWRSFAPYVRALIWSRRARGCEIWLQAKF